MNGKYSDAIAEIADGIVNSGFADEEVGTVEYGGEHYALVTLTADALADVPMSDIPVGAVGAKVIIRTDAQGFVDTFYNPASRLGDPLAYEALMRTWAGIVNEYAENADPEEFENLPEEWR